MVECLQGLDMELESIEVRRRVRAPMRSHRAFVHLTSVFDQATRSLVACIHRTDCNDVEGLLLDAISFENRRVAQVWRTSDE